MYNQTGLWSWYVSHTPLPPTPHYPHAHGRTSSTHTPALLPVWSRFPALIFSSRVPDKKERERERKRRPREKRAREQRQNAFHVFKTFTKSRKCPLFVCVEAPFSVRRDDVSYEYNTAFFVVVVCFFFFLRLLDCLRLREEEPQHLREEKGEEEGREGWRGCAADSSWYVSRFSSSLAGDWVAPFRLWAVLLSGVDGGGGEREGPSGAVPRVRGGRVRRVKRSRVSPGSLCPSLDPAVRSCSSSSLSAGCTGARWCLRWTGGRKEKICIWIDVVWFTNAAKLNLLSC